MVVRPVKTRRTRGMNRQVLEREDGEAGKHDEGQAGGVGGASGPRLAFDVQGQLFAEKEVFGRELPVGVQSGPDELKGIEQHFEDRGGDHGRMIPVGRVITERRRIASFRTDAISADHNMFRTSTTSMSGRSRAGSSRCPRMSLVRVITTTTRYCARPGRCLRTASVFATRRFRLIAIRHVTEPVIRPSDHDPAWRRARNSST